ncbi:MAG: YggS family pyridoxal phosphate enzyme [Flavobacteriaceae bacterium CG2_30_34_30]|nr:YggS family pyridoxal phosphate-dependent enzyme [Flavobacteriia bacterium]OIP51736.1 MAG: YggS family pyridoxal phosphate enzyme [Flavobacteriaceae bacterium CG2_30_34_30]PIZ07679.1 MAG: YggS family pyridoxal phosphate-dependent enzyme [Flavobacteriaceae bacterium CG_4_10_14_0_8_um_filter_34_31]PJC07623.1 MAG: YggS family pyridoxal phosphate-dependent enzyme [Flavobacteriaceae bacterium CG_4_9_14_0_8_um_filter_34_30]
MSSISDNLQKIKDSLPENITLVAVSKTKPVKDLLEAYNAGQRIFGENKVQEMTKKWEQLPKDIQWHMIGHVQTNKVKYMAPFVSLVQGVESLKLLKEINKQAAKNDRIIPCLLQIHIAKEETKFGFDTEEVTTILETDTFKSLQNIKVVGLMGMATFTQDKNQIEKEFQQIKTFFDTLKLKQETQNLKLEILSIGMSGDYKIAIKNGSTMVRVGSAIFGERNY